MKKSEFILSFVIITILYVIGLRFFIEDNIKNYEYGSYVGGVLTPYFTLISTISILYLTWSISIQDRKRSELEIKNQKRITISQMRHENLNKLTGCFDSFVESLNDIFIYEGEKNLLNEVLKKVKKKEGMIDFNAILIKMAFEVDTFEKKEYLFKTFFEVDENKKAFEELGESIIQIQKNFNVDGVSIAKENLNLFLSNKENIIRLIENYIIRDLN